VPCSIYPLFIGITVPAELEKRWRSSGASCSNTIPMSLLDLTNLKGFLPQKNIYICLREPPVLTVVIGAVCSDGIAMIADKKLTDLLGGDPQFRDKILGDLGHILMGYTGLECMFDIFRKSVVGLCFLLIHTLSITSCQDVLLHWGFLTEYLPHLYFPLNC
jgi:hypothetical protein